jgi:UDP-galactopyranose mutase
MGGVSEFLSVPFTRIHEYQNLQPERNYQTESTFISRELSRFAAQSDAPYFRVNTEADSQKLSEYWELVKQESGVWFGGRLEITNTLKCTWLLHLQYLHLITKSQALSKVLKR